MAVKPIPDGYHTVTPYLLVDDVNREIEFLTEAFGASVDHHMKGPDGAGEHAEVRIDDSAVMMGKARDAFKAMPCMIYLYVPDADATYKQALGAGATSLQEPQDMFYGDRNAGVKDPHGNMWWIATHKEDLTPEEIEKRAETAMH